jgi:hypothetical protein
MFVAERAALIVAVESFFEAGPSVPYAAADAAEILRALPAAGYAPAKCLLLAGHRTTKAILESHLDRLPKLLGKAESLLVLIISRAFTHRGRGFLACADTLHADLPGTSLPLQAVVDAIHKTKIPETTLLLDVDPLTLAGELAPTTLNEAELDKLCRESKSCCALISAAPGERSFESATLRHGVWRHHLIEALTGKTRTGMRPDGTLDAAGLQEFLADAVPRTVHRNFETPQEQTPLLFGEQNAAAVVAELASLLGPAADVLDPARMRRVVFRAESAGKVRDLAGFRKSHALPERANEWARKFVNRIAQPDLKSDIDQMFDMIREAFNYKRKDLEVSAERDGVGFIRTPDFEYTITVEVDPEEPTSVVWRREVGRLNAPEFVRSEGFVSVFGSAFDKLVFEFAEPVDVAAFVDRIEDKPPEGVKVIVASGSDTAEVKLAGHAGRIALTRDAVSIEGRSGGVPGLLDQFLLFITKFRDLGIPKALTK